MATKEMNMHRLLSELKMLDKRIANYIPVEGRLVNSNINIELIGAAKEIDKSIGTQTRKEYASTLQGNWQMIRALINNKKSLEAAKVASNANTIVKIAGKEYSVADAIKRKSDIKYDKALLHTLVFQRREAIDIVDEANEDAERLADKHVEALFGNQGKAETVPGNDITKQRENYLKNHRWGIIDPNKSDQIIKVLQEDIEMFEAEVDAVLSESNAVTMVTVELQD